MVPIQMDKEWFYRLFQIRAKKNNTWTVNVEPLFGLSSLDELCIAYYSELNKKLSERNHSEIFAIWEKAGIPKKMFYFLSERFKITFDTENSNIIPFDNVWYFYFDLRDLDPLQNFFQSFNISYYRFIFYQYYNENQDFIPYNKINKKELDKIVTYFYTQYKKLTILDLFQFAIKYHSTDRSALCFRDIYLNEKDRLKNIVAQ